MRISGFSFTRDADSLYYPIAESVGSILPICSEFIIAVGRGSTGDRTREILSSIRDPRIRIIDTEWRDELRQGQHVFAEQTNLALSACTGDWCFYLQSDEVIHEHDLPIIQDKCERLLPRGDVEGLLLNYRHFWGDYDHFIINHAWYPKEIRIIRNGLGITSYRDAQSFRRNGCKLRVAEVNAEVFHYGWVRPPCLMQNKVRSMHATYWQCRNEAATAQDQPAEFDYGSLEKLPVFSGSHPSAMRPWITKINWRDKLYCSGKSSVRHKHDRLKYRLLTSLEQNLFRGRQLGGFKNYVLVRNS